VTDVGRALRRVAIAQGAPGAVLLVLPTALVVEVPGEERSQIALSIPTLDEVRFDRATAVYRVADRALSGELSPRDGLRDLALAARLPQRFPPVVRMLGHGLAAVGIGLVLHAAGPALVWALVLGVMVGALKVWAPAGTASTVLLPTFAAFFVAVLVLTATKQGLMDRPLQALVPALVTLLPGGVLTVAVQELAAGDMISGSSRLVYGVTQLGLLAFGIVAAMELVDIGTSEAFAAGGTDPFGTLGALVGVLVLAGGFYLYYSGPARSLWYLTAVLYVAHLGQLLGSVVVAGPLSALIGALALTLAAYMSQSLPGAPPAIVTFLPAFWLLVPGAAGLVGLTQSAAGSLPQVSLTTFVGTIAGIALGVVLGTSVFRLIYRYAPVRWNLRPA
jgi:uncharacterized membrane protein YjjP (DUF1212 family)